MTAAGRAGAEPSAAEVVYTSESELRQPRALLARMRRDLAGCRELAWRLMLRDVSATYRQSLLGFVWAFAPPVLLAAGLTVVSRARILNVGSTDLPYPAYVMLGTSLWQVFVEALLGPVQGVTRARLMLARIRFPAESVVLAKVGEVLLNFGIKLVLIVGLFVWFRIPVGWTALLAPLALLVLLALGTVLGTLLAPLAILYGDVSRVLTMLTPFWFLLTPVIYPVPERRGHFATLVRLNPVTPVLVTVRELATTGVVTHLPGFLLVSAGTLLGLTVAWLVYRLAMPFAIERLGS